MDLDHEKANAVNEALKLPLAAAFERDLTALLSQERQVVLAMMDMDHFMRVNDEFGNREGDRVLIAFGEYLRASLAESARLYRFGGDEFAAIFAGGMEKEEVFLALEAIRRNYDEILPDGSKPSMTVGIAAAPEDGATYSELTRKAEGAMFRGKLMGSDRVCLAREEKMVPKTSHYTNEQLKRLTKVSAREGVGEAVLLREALDALLKKYDA